SMQLVLEEVATSFVAFHRAKERVPHLRLAGGVFANVRLNQRLHELPGVESIFVFPAMGDDGLSVGAALAEWAARSKARGRETAVRRLDDVFLGGAPTERDAEKALRRAAGPFRRVARIEEEIAGRLAARGAAGRGRGGGAGDGREGVRAARAGAPVAPLPARRSERERLDEPRAEAVGVHAVRSGRRVRRRGPPLRAVPRRGGGGAFHDD